MSYKVPIATFLLAQTSWPISFTMNKLNLMKDPQWIFVAGVVFLILATLGPFFLFRKFVKGVDPLMYVFSLFCWSAMIDLSIGLEVDGYISNFMGFYFVEGEPYLKTAHGGLISYWDGTVHFVLQLAVITLYCQRASHREVGLYWAGSILNSMVVLLPGGIAGNYPFKMSILLNVPYIILPLYAVIKFLHQAPPQSRTFFKFKPIWKRPVDLLFFLYFAAAICVALFRGLAVLNGTADAMKNYLKIYEPYLNDPTNFPKFQMLAYEYFFGVYYLFAVYGLLCPGQHWMADWSLLHAGAAAQAQFSYIAGSFHFRTSKSLHSPQSGSPALVFWAVNLTLFVVPQLFTWWCLRDVEKFGRTYTVERAELVENNDNDIHQNKQIKGGKSA